MAWDSNSCVLCSFVYHLVELHITLPPNYPEESAMKAHVRLLDTVKYSSSQCKSLQVKVNSSLQQFMVNNSQDMVNVLALIQWVDDFFSDPGDEFKSNKETSVQEAREENEKQDEEKQANGEAKEEDDTLDGDETQRGRSLGSSERSSTVNEEDNEKCWRGGTMTSAYSSHAGK